MMAIRIPPSTARGFTLIEMIVVMVITSILAGIMVLFIRRPVQNYVDAAGRAEMSDVADLALRRITRELHSALPNSVRVMTSGSVVLLEFIPTKAAGTYLSVDDNAGSPALDFQNAANKTFKVVGDMPAFPYNIVAGDYIVIYNLGPDYVTADAYAGGNRAQVASAPVNNVVTLVSNPFAVPVNGIPNTSPTQRFSVATQPVTFRCAPAATGGMELTRYWNYQFNTSQTDPSSMSNPPGQTIQHAILASNVAGCNFSYTQLQNVHSGLVGITLIVGRANSNETVTLAHQAAVENTP
ncbi:prepilin-type N-terminal cleavage/methylation domain-containing protein [Duganella sp. LX20W]|uniref:Prepilin-type N-terminal cleavage/methylation domain-containing protein n=1 Tax=Rugamonas brunnea TaxID=2758569 RepID=A0A7W2IED0_9BURK|nr:prepilin-type N-terminal cleavage/methylation domain-containing protein [Rugamonas brunnea]MBA5640200.1 prepilin-type N-terminal cleavage/methylation domain-containing protein [Rugamonas brunnea]